VVEAVMSLLSLAVLAVGLLTAVALGLLLWPASEEDEAGEESMATEEEDPPRGLHSSTEAIAEETERERLDRAPGPTDRQ
jgi:hypothetical protein